MSKKPRQWGSWTADAGYMDKGGQGLVYLVVDSARDRKGKYVLKKT